MSAEQQSKTEEATEKKVRDARADGNVPLSRDLPIAFAIVGMTLVLVFTAEGMAHATARLLAALLDHAGDIHLAALHDITNLQWILLNGVSAALLPSLALLAICGLIGGMLQKPLSLSPQRLLPDASRVSPSQGWTRLFGAGGLMDFLKSCLKLVCISGIAFWIVRSQLANALDPMAMQPQLLLDHLRSLCVPLLASVSSGIAAVAGLDFIWARRQWLTSLRMTRQEVKDEARESQGDPLVRSRMRGLARLRARSRMVAAVPRASFVVANPTHFAVALRYVRGEGEAPRVLAKGRDLLALRIREIAVAHGIPVIEDKPLARALHDVAQVDAIIPQEFYRPVAEIVNHLMRSRRGQTRMALPSKPLDGR